MPTLYGSAQAGLSEHKAKQPRFYLRSGNMWLHWSATKLTAVRKEAWSGTLDQALNCRADKDFPVASRCRPVPTTSIIPTPLNEEA